MQMIKKQKDELKNIDDEIRLELGQIRGEPLQTAAKQIEKDLNELNQAAKNGDKQKVEELSKKIAQEQKKN